jgi:Flp pilus assembly protein TadD
VDWLHLLPGVTAVALCAAAPLLVPTVRSRAPVAAGRGRVSLLAAAAVAVTLVIAAVSLGRQTLAEHFLDRGRSELAGDPAQALREADRSLRIQPEGTEASQLKAAALARYGQADASRAVLAEALRRRPDDWVTWALLGDLEVRAGDERAAARAYGRASALNPRDPGLRELAEGARP